MQETTTAADGAATGEQAREGGTRARDGIEADRLPETRKDAGKLPGLVLFFRVQLWIGIIGGGLGAAWIVYTLLAEWIWRYGPPWPLLLALGLLAGCCVLLFRAERAIAERSPEAPGRCRFLAALNIALSLLSLLLLGLLALSDRFHIPWDEILPTIPQILTGIVWSEAWRRYFTVSPRVRATFQPFGREPDPKKVMPAELGIFIVLCGSAWIWCGFDLARFLHDFSSRTAFFEQEFFVWPFLVNSLAMLLLAPAAVWALVIRNKSALLWCLGLFMGIFLFMHFAFVINMIMELWVTVPIRFPSVLQSQFIFALVFWWYFTTSERAKAYFRAA